MKVNTEALSDSKDKAEAFNNFFLSHSNVDVSQAQLHQKGSVDYKLVSVKASKQEVLDLLLSLDTTKGTRPMALVLNYYMKLDVPSYRL